jgi:hypothetical protein
MNAIGFNKGGTENRFDCQTKEYLDAIKMVVCIVLINDILI